MIQTFLLAHRLSPSIIAMTLSTANQLPE